MITLIITITHPIIISCLDNITDVYFNVERQHRQLATYRRFPLNVEMTFRNVFASSLRLDARGGLAVAAEDVEDGAAYT